MSDEFDWENDETNESQDAPQGPKALRDLVNRQKAELKRLADEQAELKTRVREAELSKAFTAKGIPEKALRLFPKDLEPTEDKVSEWVSEYGDLFGMGGQGSPAQQEAPQVTTQQTVTPDVQAQFSQMAQVAGSSAPASTTALDDLKKALANPNLVDEMPYEQYLDLLRKAGGQV